MSPCKGYNPYSVAAERFLPDKIEVLFILESPPFPPPIEWKNVDGKTINEIECKSLHKDDMVKNTKIKEGYKQTEFGVIPED